MRRKSARETLAESFRDIAKTKPVDRITIQDILDDCGYSKTTFYRAYRDKYDLMAWDYIQRHGRVMEQMDAVEDGWKRTLMDGALLFAEQRDYLRNLLMHTSGLDSFSRHMKQIHYDHLSRCVLAASGLEELDVRTEMCLRSYCQGMTDLICDWIMGVYDVCPEELAEVFDDCLPAPLRRYLP